MVENLDIKQIEDDFYKWTDDMFVTKEEWEIMAPRIAQDWENSPQLQAAINKYLWLALMKINTKLIGFNQDNLRKDYIENYDKRITESTKKC